MPHATSPPSTSASPEDTQFYVNDGQLDFYQIGYLKPTHIDTPLAEVRRRFAEDGYVFLKGILPRDDVLHARSEYFRLLSPSGVLAPDSIPAEGIFNPSSNPLDYPGIGAGQSDANGRPTGPNPEVANQFVDLALKAHSEKWYKDDFCRHPALLNYVAKFTDWGAENTIPIKRTLLRNNTPGNNAIGVHYDQIFLRHGEDTSVTAWVPMGDISLHGGGLIYLENGHNLGRKLEQEFMARAKASGFTDQEMKDAFNRNMMSGGILSQGAKQFAKDNGNGRWLLAEYEAGDVVLHNAYAIHASCINKDPRGRIRVGTDLRFVDGRKEWDRRWDKVYEFADGV
jgi:phytanoyl-CoA hydroxylase